MYKKYIENDPELVVGREYLVLTLGNEYHITYYTGKGFLGGATAFS